MQLSRPICFFDLETTGVNVKEDRIVEISIYKIPPKGDNQIKTQRINPGIPIPEGASKIHGIYDKDVADKPTFRQFAKGILSFLEGCDIGGFNSNTFDIPLMYNEFARAGIEWDYTLFNMVDVGNLFKIMEPRTLSAAVKFYTGKPHEDAHGAEPDVKATVEVFIEMLRIYDLPDSIEQLALKSNYDKPILDLSGKFTTNSEGEIIFNFGLHHGEVAKGQRGFLNWMLTRDFSKDTLTIVNKLLNI